MVKFQKLIITKNKIFYAECQDEIRNDIIELILQIILILIIKSKNENIYICEYFIFYI